MRYLIYAMILLNALVVVHGEKDEKQCEVLVISAGFVRSASTYQMLLLESLLLKDAIQDLGYWKMGEHPSSENLYPNWTFALPRIEVTHPILITKSHEFRPELYQLCSKTLVLLSYHDSIENCMNSMCAAGWTNNLYGMMTLYIRSNQHYEHWRHITNEQNILTQSKSKLRSQKERSRDELLHFLERHINKHYLSHNKNDFNMNKEANKLIPGRKKCEDGDEVQKAVAYTKDILKSMELKYRGGVGILYFLYDRPGSREETNKLSRSYVSNRDAFRNASISVATIPPDLTNECLEEQSNSTASERSSCSAFLSRQKIELCKYTPYDFTILLDTDMYGSSKYNSVDIETLVREDFLRGSAGTDIFFGGNNTRSNHSQEIDAGIIAFRKTDKVFRFLDKVIEYIKIKNVHDEQAAISLLINEGYPDSVGVSIGRLPPRWNCRRGSTREHQGLSSEVDCVFWNYSQD